MISKYVYQELVKKGLTIAFAESMTGGALTYEMVKNPGASKVIKGSIVAYSNEQKMNLLQISKTDIDSYPVVSKEIASLMAKRIKKITGSSIGVGITGNAGPSFQENTYKQEAWLAIETDHHIETYHLNLENLTRLKAILKAVHFTYETLKNLI